MYKSILTTTLLVVTFVANTTAMADSNFGVGIKAGSLGFGVEGRWKPLPFLDVRAGANAYDYDDSGDQAGVNYDATLTLDTIFLTANFRFPASPFRVTAGAFSNGNELGLVSADNSSFVIGGNPYTAAEVGTLSSVTSFGSTAPYFGIGYDFELFGKAGLNFDLGVLWQGEAEVTLVADGLAANDANFQEALERERAELEDEMSDFKAWPVISLSFVYNF